MEFFYKPLEDGTFCLTGCEGQSATVVIPEAPPVSILFDDVFKGHREITSLTLPSSLRQIGGFVVDGCENLRHLTLPQGVSDLWQYAFTRSALEEITIPGSVKMIIPFTFANSKRLRRVVVQEGTQEICAWAFQGCEALEEIVLPASLKSIHPSAFDGCGDVRQIRQS